MKPWVMAAALMAGSAASAGAPMKPAGLTRAVAVAEQATGGKATAAHAATGDRGRPLYEIDLAQGRTLHRVKVDARTAQIVSRQTPRFAGYWMRWFASDELRHVALARPLSRMLAELEQHSGGRVLDASFEVVDDRPRYDVKISTRAGVADIYLDPGTGRRLALVHD